MQPESIMIFGDSYSTYEGHIPAGYAVYYSGHRNAEPDVSDASKTWWGRLLDASGAKLVQNNSWSGSTIGYTGYNNSDCSHSSSFIYRFEKLLAEGFFAQNKVDTILVFGGTNDSWSGAPLGELKFGEIAEAELYSVLPAISHFAKRLTEALPETKVIFIANCDIKSEITGAMKAAAEHYGCGYVALAGIDKVSGHPTETGMAQICEQVLAGVRG
jgi:hypothetical protein